ncbi:MAG: UDP-N-acetylmuramoyl-L-alanine--D-glutamate ligase [Patescibacteria group bacterium]
MYTPGYFKGKKITVMGLGLLGRGVGDIRFFAEEGAELIVTDLKPESELRASLIELKHFKNITYVLGEHRLEDFRNRDFILKAASVPLDSEYITEARKNNIPIEMSTALFAALTPATIIGITGTRGKSTVTHLLYEVLQKANTSKVFLGGNVKGVSTLQFLREAKEGDIAVLELDSWQLQGFGERKISPHLAIFTTFYADHLNYYKGDMVAYLNDKSYIFKYQTEKDIFIMGDRVSDILTQKYKEDIHAQTIIARVDDIPQDWQIYMPGEHNKYNAAIVVAAARALQIPNDVIKKAIEDFKGISGRLEFIREYNGVKIYNDTTATTPDATIVGLQALRSSTNDPSTILIMGGADKNLDMSKLVQEISALTKKVILLSGTGSSRIAEDLKNALGDKLVSSDSLQHAVKLAVQCAQPGNTILLSPAFASFGMFTNEFERGESFNKLIRFL